MILYALRLLVALLTFAVGAASAWLFDFNKQAPARPYAYRNCSRGGR
jgi:hypothetical protein